MFSLLILGPVLNGSGQEELPLDVPWFGQEESWADQGLGDSPTITIRTHGCALTSSAMVLNYLGVKTNPEELNRWLLENEGFEEGWDDEDGTYLGRVRLIWNSPVQGFPEIKEFNRYDFHSEPADLALIRSYLDRGIPVIAEVLRPQGIPHFVVLIAYSEDDFLIRDPLESDTKYLSEDYNISDKYGSGAARNIFGIRVYIPVD
ncbi:C39 family peptidase [Oceanispirochaeta sp.]|uniref:C39 family peptidase n=1 Tax=Oceanispirochaeta sp. TaxID=2035350 RepID=UPI002607C9A6|nr:C39 family peptidase [Oceanispirochaeta sp.]MDA3955855.1 C39 family peptidase [Oceanispirochaeta sp.]